jgi:hypothetical protein
MIQFKVAITEKTIKLNLMGREKIYNNGDIVTEDAYTKAYPKYFKRMGEIKGYDTYLSTPVFVPDRIEDFVKKEVERKKVITKKVSKKKEVEIDEIAIAAEEFLEDKNIETNEEIENSIDKLFEDESDFNKDDVKIETEE